MFNIIGIAEKNVVTKYSQEINHFEDKDSINKLYRQARVWVRFHCHYANACSEEHSRELNETLKSIRISRLKELGYIK